MSGTLVSLFAGIGGFDLGLERAGWRPVGMCEIDPHARSVLDRHWPDVPKHDDVTTLTGSTFGPADVITFGSPCQDLSVAGKRAGLAGERSGLFTEAVRYIREMLEETNGTHPRFAVWENVPGAFSSNKGADFAAVLEELVGGKVRPPTAGWANAGVAFGPLGAAEWRVLDSRYFGVAQRRRRVFLIYHPGGESAGQVLLDPEGLRWDSPASSKAGEGAASALTGSFGNGGASSAGRPDDLTPILGISQEFDAAPELVGTLTTTGGGGGGKQPMVAMPQVANALTAREGKGPDSDMTTTLVRDVAPTVTASWGHNGYSSPRGDGTDPIVPIAFALRGREEGAVPEPSGEQVNALRGSEGGSSRDYVAFAENSRNEVRLEGGDGQVVGALSTGGGKPGQGTPTIATTYAVRRLTPVECERLQAFPDDHTRYAADGTEIADTHRYRMLGNAVTVNVAHAIGNALRYAT